MINASGLATAGIVYQKTAATPLGIYHGNTGTLALTVKNVNTEDFGSCAGDGLADNWQVQYFGLPPNPPAGPLFDPDGDGQNNRIERLAGLVQTDRNSLIRLRIERSFQDAHPIFSPIAAGRTYTVTFGHDLLPLPPWPALAPACPLSISGHRVWWSIPVSLRHPRSAIGWRSDAEFDYSSPTSADQKKTGLACRRCRVPCLRREIGWSLSPENQG